MNYSMNSIETLLKEEEGTAMTEFALTLPIFLFFFGALIGLGSTTHAAIDAHTNAAPQLWQEAYAAETDGDRMSPRTSSWSDPLPGGAGGLIGTVGDFYYRGKGHWGESRMAVGTFMPIATGQDIPNTAGGNEISTNLTHTASNIIGNSRAAGGVADDTLNLGGVNLWSLSGGPVDLIITEVLSAVTQALGVNLGYGANMRYGTVEASHTETASLPYGLPDATYSVGYSSLISPSPTNDTGVDDILPNDWTESPESRAWTASRLWVETEPQYRNLFSIYNNNTPDRLKKNASSDVPVIYDDYGTNPDNPWWCLWC